MQSVFNISVSLTRRGESRAALVHTDDPDMHTNLVRIAGFNTHHEVIALGWDL